MTRYVAVDLSRMPRPDVVTVPDYLALVATRKADVVARVRQLDATLADALEATLAIEGELITKLVESGAYRQTLHYARVNDASRAVMLAYAAGADLDHLGAYYGVQRFVGEDDERLRRRVQLAPEALSTAGPRGAYVFHALSYSLDVLDADVVKPSPGQLQLHVVSKLGDGTPSPDLLSGLARRFRDENLTPFTDSVSVRSAVFSNFTVEARLTLGIGPDASLVRTAATAAINVYLKSRKRIGVPVTRSGLIAAAHVDAVENVTLLQPAADVDPGPGGFARSTGVAVSSISA